MDYVSLFFKSILKNPWNFLKLPLTFLLAVSSIITSTLNSAQPAMNVSRSGSTQSDYYEVGFGKCEIMPDSLTDKKGNYLYHLAGFDNITLATEIADPLYARSVWVDDKSGAGGIALVSVDCIGLVYADTTEVKSRLADWCKQTGCRGIEIMSTHCHEAIDTLGYWGDLYSLSSGRDKDYMEIVFNGIINAVKSSYTDRREGTLSYGSISADGAIVPMDNGSYFNFYLSDSRAPSFYKADLTRIRFIPKDKNASEIHIFNYSAHPEVFRLNCWSKSGVGLLTADYVAYLCARDKELTGADSIVFAGAIGGLIAIRGYECDANGNYVYLEKLYIPFAQELFKRGVTDKAGLIESTGRLYIEYYSEEEWNALTDAEKEEMSYYFAPDIEPDIWNEWSVAYYQQHDKYARELTVKVGNWLAEQSQLIANEKPLAVSLNVATAQTDIPVENKVFKLASFGGIMAGKGHLDFADGKMRILNRTEVACINLGGLKIALVPGEIFPELAYNGCCQAAQINPDKQNPETLSGIAKDDSLLVFGLANDEIGYIVTPERFLLDEKLPYIQAGVESGNYSRHYEETMSMGPDTAYYIADAFKKAVNALDAAQ